MHVFCTYYHDLYVTDKGAMPFGRCSMVILTVISDTVVQWRNHAAYFGCSYRMKIQSFGVQPVQITQYVKCKLFVSPVIPVGAVRA